ERTGHQLCHPAVAPPGLHRLPVRGGRDSLAPDPPERASRNLTRRIPEGRSEWTRDLIRGGTLELRRYSTGFIWRPGRDGRRHAVPSQRGAGPQRAGGATPGGGASLRELWRQESHQRSEPRPHHRTTGRTEGAWTGSPHLLG